MSAAFVHLRVHSEYSLADGMLKARAIPGAVKDRGMGAVALTDRSNLFGLVKFYSACINQGVKPIVGADLVCRSDAETTGRLTVLAMNDVGYRNLIRLVSKAYVDAPERAVVGRDEVAALGDGLLVLSGGIQGDVGQALLQGDVDVARRRAAWWQSEFPNRYYLEVARTGKPAEDTHVAGVVALAAEMALPVVAVNDVCFLSADDYEAHETRVCIHESRVLDDSRRERRYTPHQHLKSSEEMAALFSDLPEAVANTVEIARRCSVKVALGTYFLPNYPIPEGHTPESFLSERSSAGLRERLAVIGLQPIAVAPAQQAPIATGERVVAEQQGSANDKEVFTTADYQARLEYELGVINQMGFAGYFLIVMEFIAWARQQKIPVGPGRGSGAGSLVAYCLGITDLDPLAYDLLFERFLNPERVSMPDFDVDFCMEGRDAVINHVSELYGADAVSQIITFGTMAAKAVVRDVARVQGKAYGLADKLSKLIPFEVGMTLTKAMAESAELVEFVTGNEEVGEIMEMAYKLEGIVRNVGRHAGGVVIAPSALTDFVPLYVDDQSGGLVSQFDKDDVESAGLVKFDFLGLKTLTIIDWAVITINAERRAAGNVPGNDEPLNIDQIPLDDPATFALLRRAETTGVFQLESRGMKDLIRRLKPDNIDDIIALVALFRPGPLQSGAVDDYINRKHGAEPVTYPHPSLEEVLEGTYGVVLYQEQVMQIAQELAGFSLGQADLLRRAMGKKKPEEMARVREQFVAGAAERGVDVTLTNEIFDLMEKFAGYAFNKSHSATYAVVSYQTAWLKTHYPAQFMAANLSADMQNTDKVVTLIDEVRRMELNLCTPSVNEGLFRFSGADNAVVYGLGAVKGVGEGPVQNIVEARSTAGGFADLRDFLARVDSRRVNKRALEALIRSGAMDCFSDANESRDDIRARLMAELPDAVAGADQVARDQAIGMTDLFGEATAERRVVPKLSLKARLAGEKESLGLYLTGHPIESYEAELSRIARLRIVDLRAEKKTQRVAGMVVSVRVMKSRRGQPMSFLQLDDKSGRLEVSLFPEVHAEHYSKVTRDDIILVEGEVSADEYSGGVQMRAERVYGIEEARSRFAKALDIDLCQAPVPADLPQRLKLLLEPYRAHGTHPVQCPGCPVAIIYEQISGDSRLARGRIQFGPEWRVAASDELLASLREEFGDARVKLTYG